MTKHQMSGCPLLFSKRNNDKNFSWHLVFSCQPIQWKGHLSFAYLSNGRDIEKTLENFFFRFFKLKTSKLTSEISWPLAAPGDLSSTENSLYLSPLQPRTAIPPPPPQLAGEARGEPLREAKVERRCCSGFRLFFCYEVRVLRVL